MFRLIKEVFCRTLATKCMSLKNEPCLARHTLIDLDPNKIHYYPFMVSLEGCNRSFDTFDDPFFKICVLTNIEYAK